MIRIVFAVAFLGASVAAVSSAFRVGADTPWGNVLINLGTEIFGILVMLAVVDLFLERRRLHDRARELAWGLLHAVERAVWVWQGGPRRLGTDELLGLISDIDPSAPLQPSTRGLLVNLGLRSREILDIEPRAARMLPRLERAAADLSILRGLQDGDSGLSLRTAVEVLESATVELARLLGQPSQKMPGALVRRRDPSPEAQATRFLDGASQRGEAWAGGAGAPSR